MAVQFILGRSGTGKTSYCVQAVVDALLEPSDQRLIFLVPEQATYQAERAILTNKRVEGYSRLSVLSFDRLQFLLLGKNTARPSLSRIGQQMVIHRILRNNKDNLKIFYSSADSTGLARRMAQTIIELHQYAKTPEDIERLLADLDKGRPNSMTALKFQDIALILRDYLQFIENRFIDPDVQRANACQAVAKADLLKGAKLWVDGFASFTAGELAVLSEMLKVVAESHIALCLDPSNIDLVNPKTKSVEQADLFSPTQDTYASFIDMIKQLKLKLAKPVILDRLVRFSACPQLAHIERNIFEQKKLRIPASETIRIVSAPNARAEVQFVAKQVLQLVKEKDYRYRDIAVIASDIDSYEHYIRAYFDDYRVPFFIDKRKPLNQHPLAELICSALQAITDGFSNSEIFSYLKTDLVPIERVEVDVLENYCFAFGITQTDWTNPQQWCFAEKGDNSFDQEQINVIRQKAIEPLSHLQDALYPAKLISAEEFTKAIFTFLETLQVRKTLQNWIEAAIEDSDHHTADEHQQFFDRLVNVFDELVEVFGDSPLSAADYLAILRSAFSQLSLAFIPPSLDQVLVGSIERSRHPDLKAVFLIGATQRQFPVPLNPSGVLSDNDRCAAESADFSLAGSTTSALFERQYLAYIAFTRPTEYLCITYPSTDENGSSLARSQFIDELQSLFVDLEEDQITDEQVNIADVHNEIELANALCFRLGKDAPKAQADENRELITLLGELYSDRLFENIAKSVTSALDYDNHAELDADLLPKLFGQKVRSSATRLTTFAACPYRYFARYVLELTERKEFKFEPLDLGNFYHIVLDALLKKVIAQGKDFATIAKGELLELLSREISRLISEHPFVSNFARHSAHNMFIINSAAEVLEDCVLAIAQIVQEGSFRPKLSEVAFGDVEQTRETLGKYEIALSNGRVLSLDGKIDRLDIAEIDDKNIVIIFDYKRREQTFSWSKFYYGLDMQLPIYLLAVRNSTGSKHNFHDAVGAFFIPVETPIETIALDELARRADKFQHKAKGIFNGEFAQQLDERASRDSKFYNFYTTKDGNPYGIYENRGALKPSDFEKILQFTEKKMVWLAEEIISGKIDIIPYRLGGKSPCEFCKYKTLCRFDWQINDYNLLKSLNKTQVLEKIQLKV
jgi:ATP-dependent helicase/nuclease subunit B